jgi:hypothetical protein
VQNLSISLVIKSTEDICSFKIIVKHPKISFLHKRSLIHIIVEYVRTSLQRSIQPSSLSSLRLVIEFKKMSSTIARVCTFSLRRDRIDRRTLNDRDKRPPIMKKYNRLHLILRKVTLDSLDYVQGLRSFFCFR